MRMRCALVAIGTAFLLVSGSATAQPVSGNARGGVVISPDGRYLYATGTRNSTLTYARNQATGTLALIGSTEPGGEEFVLSPDGRNGYAVEDDEVAITARDSDTGLMTHQGTMRGVPGEISSIAIAPDGRHIYLADISAEALVTLARDPATGSLRVTDVVYGGPGGVAWLDRPRDIAISPDGRSVYVGLTSGVGLFARNSSGALHPVGEPEPAGGTVTAVTVAPDSARVYAGTASYYAYDRDPGSGALTQRGVLYSGCPPPPDPEVVPCLQSEALAVQPDSTAVASLAEGGRTLTLARAVPEGVERVADYVEGRAGVTGLDRPQRLAWSPDGRFLYVAAALEPREVGPPTISTWSREPSGLRLLTVERLLYEPFAAGTAVSIENGAQYTNTAQVTVTARPAIGSTTVRLASTPGALVLASPRRVDPDGRYPATLDDTGLGRDVRRVYVRSGPAYSRQGPPVTVSDDIILDQRLPEIVSGVLQPAPPLPGRPGPSLRPVGRGAGAGPVRRGRARARRYRTRLRLRARDNRSGVGRVQITTRRSRPGPRVRYRRRIVLRGRPSRVWVRVIDRAGNRSRWRLVRRSPTRPT